MTDVKTLQPTIFVRASQQIQQAMQDGMIARVPKEITGNFDGRSTQTLGFKPKLEWGSAPQDVDSLHLAPHLILYMFVCAGKQAYQSEEKTKLLAFYQRFNSPKMPVIPIFVNDPRVKVKGLFSQVSSLITTMQTDVPNLLVVHVKNSGLAKKADWARVWPILMVEIVKCV